MQAENVVDDSEHSDAVVEERGGAIGSGCQIEAVGDHHADQMKE